MRVVRVSGANRGQPRREYHRGGIEIWLADLEVDDGMTGAFEHLGALEHFHDEKGGHVGGTAANE